MDLRSRKVNFVKKCRFSFNRSTIFSAAKSWGRHRESRSCSSIIIPY